MKTRTRLNFLLVYFSRFEREQTDRTCTKTGVGGAAEGEEGGEKQILS